MSKYRYDIHVHTSQSSKCGHILAADMVDEYIARGYSGIAITDHLHRDFIESQPNSDDWDACIDAFLEGYNSAKARADSIDKDFDVILSAEIRFGANGNDYLLFGIDEAFLRANPFVFRMELDTFYDKFKDQLIIIQAHPYRGGGVGIYPQYLHGVEIINCNERHDNGNEKAIKTTKENSHLIRISASDAHRPEDIGRASINTENRIRNSYELKDLLVGGGYQLDSPEFSTLLESAGIFESIR